VCRKWWILGKVQTVWNGTALKVKRYTGNVCNAGTILNGKSITSDQTSNYAIRNYAVRECSSLQSLYLGSRIPL